jgi:hypothetical protein
MLLEKRPRKWVVYIASQTGKVLFSAITTLGWCQCQVIYRLAYQLYDTLLIAEEGHQAQINLWN